MATPQYTIKVGADSSDYFCREVTISDKQKGFEVGDNSQSKLGLVKDSDYNISDDYQYPVLVRRTGDSLKGTTESIESQELRKGKTKSAPRKGNSSSEGSLDYELSPETYDDIFEAALRGEWKIWVSDSKVKGLDDVEYVKSKTNLDNFVYTDGTFESKIRQNGDMLEDLPAGKHETKLLSNITDEEFSVVKVSDVNKVEVHELTCGEHDVRYNVLKHFGGVKNDDLFQNFEHLAVNTVSLSVTPGQIITGSFGFMGSNNPEIVQWGSDYTLAKKFIAAVAETNGYFTYNEETKVYTVATPQPTSGTFGNGTYYTNTANGCVKKLENHLLKDTTTVRTNAEVMTWLAKLPEKGTNTEQYTAREGFLYINGERVRYGSNLTFELNNGLNKVFAIFEKDAISMSALQLDITGQLEAYLIKGYSEKLYQLAVQDKDVEIVFCFQDREEDPEALYVVQIFKTKFTDTDVSSGAEELQVTFPYQSFEEKACRMLRIRKRRVRSITFDAESMNKITVAFTTVPPITPVDGQDITCSVKVDGSEVISIIDTTSFATKGTVDYTFNAITQGEAEKDVEFVITYNDISMVKTYSVAAAKSNSTDPGPSTDPADTNTDPSNP